MLLAIGAVFIACSKEPEKVTVQFRLTDAPCETCQQVNVEIREIQIKMAGEDEAWISVPTTAGIYDLLEYQNGEDILIATAELPEGEELKEVRFVLGEDNTVMVDDQLHPLTTPSAQQSGLKVKINKELDQSDQTFILDFDARESVREQNGGYALHPVIKLK